MAATSRAYEVIGVLLFLGAMGKSAQIGLHTWLPDAMEGPTPVSALIHAATMVTAGCSWWRGCRRSWNARRVRRLSDVHRGDDGLFAATIGCVQNDIKRIIAYSTCSQLGYMFIAAGVGAYQASIFHLFTHAFFKALLFLGAGSVIHAMSDEQDIRNMGGHLAADPGDLCGDVDRQPGACGHSVLCRLLFQGRDPGGGLGADRLAAVWVLVRPIAAFLTAFYSWRLMILTFHGRLGRMQHAWTMCMRARRHAGAAAAAGCRCGADGLRVRGTRFIGEDWRSSGRGDLQPGRRTTFWRRWSTCPG